MYFLTVVACGVVVPFIGGVALTALGPRGPTESTTRLARAVITAIWVFALFVAAFEWVTGDWVHCWWAVQIPLVCIFLCSGPFLARGSTEAPIDAEQPRVRFPRLALEWRMLAMLISLGLVPVIMQLALPPQSFGRNTGRPFPRVVELATWGFGGALPEALEPITAADRPRGVGHLPREVTVPVAALLAAAWLWIGFCGLLLMRKLLPANRVRRAFVWLAPLVLGCLCSAVSGRPPDSFGWFDPNLFWPFDSQETGGVWRSDPVTLRSFGPVLLLALGSAVVLAVSQAITAAVRDRSSRIASGVRAES
jgi:hypothetical protein